MTQQDTQPPAETLAEAREAAALAFDARARKASHPEVATLERDHAKMIRAGEGDEYDAVQAAVIALTRRAGGDAIPAGMKPWHGGDSAPADWDGGPVLRRHGGMSMPRGNFAWVSADGGLGNIVAYTSTDPAHVRSAFDAGFVAGVRIFNVCGDFSKEGEAAWSAYAPPAALKPPVGGETTGQSDGDPDGWLAVKVNAEGGIVMPYGPLHAGPDRPNDARYRWAPFYLGEPK